MSTLSYLPYNTLGQRLTLTAELLDGDTPTSATGEIMANEVDADPLRLRFQVGDWDQDLDDALPDDERKVRPVSLLLVFRSDQSRRRLAVPIQGSEHTAEFDRAKWRGSMIAQAFIVRTKERPNAGDGVATDAGAMITWSTPLTVHFDEPARPPGDRLEVRWEDFRTSPDSWRKRHDDDIFALDLLSSERPVVRLNSAFPNLKTVLNNAASHGRAARIRDATNFMIAHQVWTSLIASATAAVRDTHEASPDRPPRELLDELVEWERKIIEDWSRYLYSDHNTDESLDKMLQACIDAVGAQVVMVRIPNAIQARFSTTKGFAGLVRDSRLFAES